MREAESRDVEAGILGLLDDTADAPGDELGRRPVREAEVEGVPLQPRRKRGRSELPARQWQSGDAFELLAVGGRQVRQCAQVVDRIAGERSSPPIEVFRIDEIEGDYEISDRIMREIDGADAVVADFTLSARNVYLEAGYARARGKPIIQTARRGETLEFDTRNWRTIFYRNATELEEKLIPALGDAYDNWSA